MVFFYYFASSSRAFLFLKRQWNILGWGIDNSFLPLIDKLYTINHLRTILVFCLSFSISSIAAISQYKINNKFPNDTLQAYRIIQWGTENGLSMGICPVILRDKTGFIWIATPVGLNRFDGNLFKNYFPDKSKPGSIIGSRISGLVEDSLNHIWVGTDRGLSRYDHLTDTFMNFPLVISTASNTFSFPFWATRDEVFCIEAGFNLSAYNIYTFKRRVLMYNINIYPGNDLTKLTFSIFDTRRNDIWILEEDSLLQVSLIDGKIKRYSWFCNKLQEDHIHGASAMRYDAAPTISGSTRVMAF
jgi:hypothetical protein